MKPIAEMLLVREANVRCECTVKRADPSVWRSESLHCLHLAEFWPSWMIDDNRPPVSKGLDRVPGIARHDRNYTCARDFGHAVDRHLQLPLDHFVDLFLNMRVLVNGRTAREVIMRKSHVWGVKIAPFPTG